MTKLIQSKTILFVFFTAVFFSLPSNAQYYEGKRVEVVIPTSPGGGTDTFARLIADGLKKHLDGNAGIIPRQMTGGGGQMASNYVVDKAPKDGTVLLAGTGQGTLRQLLREKNIKTKMEDFEVLVSVPVSRNVFIANGKGLNDVSELKNLQDGKGLYTALVDPISGITFLLQSGMTDMKLNVIKGYEGGKDRDLAMLRGEIDIIQQINITYESSSKLILRRGGLHLWNDGLLSTNDTIVRDKSLPDVPTFPEAYEIAFGEQPSGQIYEAYKAVVALVGNTGKTILVSKHAPEEAKNALKEAMVKMANDPKFSKRILKENRGHGLIYGDELESAISKARNLSPEIISFLQDYISERYEIEFIK